MAAPVLWPVSGSKKSVVLGCSAGSWKSSSLQKSLSVCNRDWGIGEYGHDAKRKPFKISSCYQNKAWLIAVKPKNIRWTTRKRQFSDHSPPHALHEASNLGAEGPESENNILPCNKVTNNAHARRKWTFFLYCLKQARFLTHEWSHLCNLSHYSAIALYTHNVPFPNGCHVTLRGWYSSVSWINLSDRDLYEKQLFTIPYPWKTNPVQTVYRVCNKKNKNGTFMSQSPRAYKPQGFLLLPTSQEGNFISFSPVALRPIRKQKIHFQSINTITSARRSQVDTHIAVIENVGLSWVFSLQSQSTASTDANIKAAIKVTFASTSPLKYNFSHYWFFLRFGRGCHIWHSHTKTKYGFSITTKSWVIFWHVSWFTLLFNTHS